MVATVAAALVCLIASLLPWATAFGTSIAGTSTDDGKFALVVAVVGLACYAMAPYRVPFAITHAALGAMSGAIGLYDAVHISRAIADASALASTGPGVYLMAVGGGAWCVLALLSLKRTAASTS